MSPAITTLGETVWDLPPLILHPFNEKVAPSTLLESSKAALMLSGLIPTEGADPDELHRRLLSGRYAEMRMLFYLGKDVFRWIDQCVESTQEAPEFCCPGNSPPEFCGPVDQESARGGQGKTVALGRGGLRVDLLARHRDERHVRLSAAVSNPERGLPPQLPPLPGLPVPLLHGVGAARKPAPREFPFRLVRFGRILAHAGEPVGWRLRRLRPSIQRRDAENAEEAQRRKATLTGGTVRTASRSDLTWFSLRLSLRSLRLCVETIFPPTHSLPERPPILLQVLRRLRAAQDHPLESLFQDEPEGIRLAQFAVLVQHPPHTERSVDRHLHAPRRGPLQHARKGLLHLIVGELQDTVSPFRYGQAGRFHVADAGADARDAERRGVFPGARQFDRAQHLEGGLV